MGCDATCVSFLNHIIRAIPFLVPFLLALGIRLRCKRKEEDK